MVSATNTSSTELPRAIVAENGVDPSEAGLDSDTLVEEISIDGMCGVY